jgi:hypothetical protein
MIERTMEVSATVDRFVALGLILIVAGCAGVLVVMLLRARREIHRLEVMNWALMQPRRVNEILATAVGSIRKGDMVTTIDAPLNGPIRVGTIISPAPGGRYWVDVDGVTRRRH